MPHQGLNPCPLPWQPGVLTTGLPGKSHGLAVLTLRSFHLIRLCHPVACPCLCQPHHLDMLLQLLKTRSPGWHLSLAPQLWSPWVTQTSPGRPCGPLLHEYLLYSSSVTFFLEPTTSDVINLTITLLNSLLSSSCA